MEQHRGGAEPVQYPDHAGPVNPGVPKQSDSLRISFVPPDHYCTITSMRSAPHLDLVLDLVKHLVHLRVRDLVHGAHVHGRAARVLGGLRQGQGGFNQPEKESIPTTTTCYVYPALKAYPVPYRALKKDTRYTRVSRVSLRGNAVYCRLCFTFHGRARLSCDASFASRWSMRHEVSRLSRLRLGQEQHTSA